MLGMGSNMYLYLYLNTVIRGICIFICILFKRLISDEFVFVFVFDYFI